MRKHDWLVAAALAALLVLLGSFQMIPDVCGVYHDDAIYISTAKALSEGQGYRLINLPNSPLQTKYPIFYPALLAITWKFWPSFPDNLLAMKWLTLLIGAATVGLAYLYMVNCNYFSRKVAAAAGLLTATSAPFLYFCTLTLSEIPFGFMVVQAAWALERHVDGTEGSRLSEFSLGLLLALPFLNKSIGIVFAPIGLGILYLYDRSIRWVSLGAAVLLFPWIVWMLMGAGWNDQEVTSYYTNYLTWWSSSAIGTLSRVVAMNVIYILCGSISIGLGIFNVELFFPASAWMLVLLTGGILYVGMIRNLRQYRVLAFFLAGYLFIILIWPWPSPRFLMPILPFLLAYLLDWISNQLPKLASIAPPKISGTIVLTVLLACNMALVRQVVAASHSMHYPSLKQMKEPLSWSSYVRVFEWITAHTRPEDVITSGLDTMIYLYTNRRAFRPFVGRPLSLFYGDDGPPLGSLDEIIRSINSYKADYLVHTPMPMFREEAPMNEFIEQVQKTYPGWLKAVYVGDDKRFAIFKLQSDHDHDN